MPVKGHGVSRMKKQSLRRSSGSTPPIPVRHQLDHVVPTVIHHPEEKMTALGRLTHHVLQDPRKYSTWALVIAVVVLAAVAGWNFTTGARSRTSEVWSKLDTATKAEDRVAIAKLYPNSPASTWALLKAATEYYNLALSDLPHNRDVAVPYFTKAYNLFDQVEREAPKDSYQARIAALGKGRSLEASYEISKAIQQYELVAKNWPGSVEANQALQFATALQRPEAAAFYKELYAYSPTRVTLPPFGSEMLNSRSPGSSSPTAIPGSASKKGLLPEMPLELSPPTLDELPADVFARKPASSQPKPAPK
jgi:tetratricopeptide (TPR) repeat protein